MIQFLSSISNDGLVLKTAKIRKNYISATYFFDFFSIFFLSKGIIQN